MNKLEIPITKVKLDSDIKKDLVFDWPKPLDSYLFEENVDVVVQINGKKRALVNVKKGTTEENIINKAIIEKNVKKYIENKEIIKKIYVKDRLLNLILKWKNISNILS